jgi:hypothetical protein
MPDTHNVDYRSGNVDGIMRQGSRIQVHACLMGSFHSQAACKQPACMSARTHLERTTR